MRKKKALAFSTLVQAIIVLVVIFGGGKIVWDLSSKPVKYLLGAGNISAFDDELKERYNLTQSLNKDAIDSTNALLFAINNIAYIDTYSENKDKAGKLDFMNKENYKGYEKTFGSVEVKPTYYDRETVFIPLEADMEQGKRELAFGAISCWQMFEDKDNDDTRCYSITFGDGYKYLQELDELNEDTFMKWMSGNKKGICSSFTQRFKGIPKEKCSDIIDEITGDTWNPFNVNNIEWDELSSNYFTSKEGKEISICASNSGLNEIFFHADSKGNLCGAKSNTDIPLSYKVKGFTLPQKIEKSSNFIDYTVEDWLFAYGDPEYILFYEKFPQEEAQYWEMSNYQVAFTTILVTQAAFLGVDLITLGLGKALKPVFAPLRTLFKGGSKALSPFKAAVKSVGGAIGKGLKKIFSKAVDSILRRTATREAIGESAEGIIKSRIMSAIGKKSLNEVDDVLLAKMKNQYVKSFDNVVESGIKEAFDNGRLTKQGLDLLDFEFKQLMKEVPDVAATAVRNGELKALRLIAERKALGETFDEATEETIKKSVIKNMEKELTDQNYIARNFKQILGDSYDDTIYKVGKDVAQAASDASFRAIPRTTIRTVRVVQRAQNFLKTILLGDMTDEAREKALVTMLKEGDDALSHMKPADLRGFLANQQKAKDLLLDKQTGKLILGELDDEFTEAAQQQALSRLDNILSSKTAEELVPKTQQILQSFSSSSLDILTKKRNLVAAIAAVVATRIESMAEKNYPVGTNAIGLKTPYKHTVPFTEINTGVNYSEINEAVIKESQDKQLIYKVEKAKSRSEEILSNYGAEGYQGLIPEVNRYYLSLTKDKGLFDQDDQRFHLVSPCETDLLVEVTRCQCWYHEDVESGIYETAKKYEIMGEDESGNRVSTGVFTEYPSFDGEKPMLYALDENGEAVKQCHPSGLFQFDDLHEPMCIKINPLMENYGENNYCYHGISAWDNIIKGAVSTAEFGLPFLGLFCGPAAATACMSGLFFVTGVAGETLKAAAIDIPSQWPSHD